MSFRLLTTYVNDPYPGNQPVITPSCNAPYASRVNPVNQTHSPRFGCSLKLRRIAEIQSHILQALGISDPTAYSTPKLSEDQELRLISTLNRTRVSSDGSNVVKAFECMVAACEYETLYVAC